ncbi:MAG: class I SAM-dependent methyltransferase, partial [Candidatus Latescibacterota bacterium]
MRTKSAGPADKHRLYEMSVQDPSEEIRFIRRVYRKRFGSYPSLLREDFCGTAAVCCRWATISPRNRAVGIDLNHSIISWARRHHLHAIGTAADRVRLVRGDVLRPPAFRPHVVVAMNFSYFTFKERSVLLSYLSGVRRALLPKGILVLDIYG